MPVFKKLTNLMRKSDFPSAIVRNRNLVSKRQNYNEIQNSNF